MIVRDDDRPFPHHLPHQYDQKHPKPCRENPKNRNFPEVLALAFGAGAATLCAAAADGASGCRPRRSKRFGFKSHPEAQVCRALLRVS